MISDYTTQLVKKTKVAPNIYFLRFKLIRPTELKFKAGQYMLLKINNNYRQYSIASSEHERGHFDLIVEIVPKGLASRYFLKLNAGECVNFKGPAGVFVLRNTKKDKIFLATGTGIAPIRSMINSILTKRHDNLQVYLYWGVRTKKDAYLIDGFKELSNRYRQFNFQICLSRDKITKTDKKDFLFSGRINKCFAQFLKESNRGPADFEYYICGGRTVVEELSIYIENLGVVKDNIVHERFN